MRLLEIEIFYCCLFRFLFFLMQCQKSINTLNSFHWHAILLNIFPCPRQLHTPLLNVPFKNPFKSKWRRGVPSNLLRSSLIFSPLFVETLSRVSRLGCNKGGQVGGMKRDQTTSGTTDGPSWFNRMKGKSPSYKLFTGVL